MPDFKLFTQKYIAFRDARDWAQYQRPKDASLSLMLEATEVLELFQWKTDEQAMQAIAHNPEKLADELADVMGMVLILAHDCNIDLVAALEHKLAKHAIHPSNGVVQQYREL